MMRRVVATAGLALAVLVAGTLGCGKPEEPVAAAPKQAPGEQRPAAVDPGSAMAPKIQYECFLQTCCRDLPDPSRAVTGPPADRPLSDRTPAATRRPEPYGCARCPG